MSTQPSPEAVLKSVTVQCEVATAFRVWTEQIQHWWPQGHSRSGDPNTTVILEAKVGGRFYEQTSQGDEHEWGEVTAWDPPHHFAYHWYLGSGPMQPTHVDVRFTSQSATSTRVDVTHRGPELIGELWGRNNARYDTAWDVVLGSFLAFVAPN